MSLDIILGMTDGRYLSLTHTEEGHQLGESVQVLGVDIGRFAEICLSGCRRLGKGSPPGVTALSSKHPELSTISSITEVNVDSLVKSLCRSNSNNRALAWVQYTVSVPCTTPTYGSAQMC